VSAIVIIGFLSKWDRASLGLTIRPAQGVKYWTKVTLFLGGIVSVFSVCALGFLWVFDVPTPDLRNFTHPSQMLPWLLSACIAAPIFQEGIYRFALCTPCAALLGKWGAILISGVAFSAIHFVYGNPGPDNLIAGFLLAWAYLKSGSILVPIALHSLGNLCIFVFQVIVYYPNGA
jgi:membrane protease YdiL (CAAX protease family)